MNDILKLQDEEDQLKFMRARQQSYVHARIVNGAQLAIALGLPLLGAYAAASYPHYRPHVAAASLLAILLDALVLDRLFKVFNKRAAALSEEFDCAVFDLPWDKNAVPDRVENEDVRALSKAYSRYWKEERIRKWYLGPLDQMPLHFGRIVCQRSNISYDSELRRSYARILAVVGFTLAVALFVMGLAWDYTMTQWVLSLAPATPLMSWAAKEYYRQTDAASALNSLRKQVRALWELAMSEAAPEQCRLGSRELQSAIYRYRAGSPLVLPFLYRLKRLSLEDRMQAAADDFFKEYQKKFGAL